MIQSCDDEDWLSSGTLGISAWCFAVLIVKQFAPQVGDVNNNLNRADAVLSKANPKDLDLLVLPEMAFSGESKSAISRKPG